MRVKKALCHSSRSAHSLRCVRSVWKISKMLSPWKGCDTEESVVGEFDGIRQEAEIWSLVSFLSRVKPGLQAGMFCRNSVLLS